MRIREASVTDAPAIAKVTVDTWKTAMVNPAYRKKESWMPDTIMIRPLKPGEKKGQRTN